MWLDTKAASQLLWWETVLPGSFGQQRGEMEACSSAWYGGSAPGICTTICPSSLCASQLRSPTQEQTCFTSETAASGALRPPLLSLTICPAFSYPGEEHTIKHSSDMGGGDCRYPLKFQWEWLIKFPLRGLWQVNKGLHEYIKVSLRCFSPTLIWQGYTQDLPHAPDCLGCLPHTPSAEVRPGSMERGAAWLERKGRGSAWLLRLTVFQGLWQFLLEDPWGLLQPPDRLRRRGRGREWGV